MEKRQEVLPARVRDLARTVTAGATNPYDQASQIEAYLRTLTYDLKVPLVAADRDLVDAFLFDLRRGYCDYFASAFVVMARSVGLPARLAVGYASGQTVAPGVWVVSAADAHSWPEVYFEGVGWVPFEPTPARPMPAPLRAPLSVASTPTQSANAQPFAAAWWIGSLALLLAGAFWLLLRANSGAGLSYRWQRNGLNISMATFATYTATQAGSYRVIVTNAQGCPDTSAVITVSTGPGAAVALSGPTGSGQTRNSAVSAASGCHGPGTRRRATTTRAGNWRRAMELSLIHI